MSLSLTGYLALILLLFTTACSSKPLTISFTGDIMMHRPVQKSARLHNKNKPGTRISVNNKGNDFLFKPVAERLNSSDILIGNMEFPILPPYSNSKNMIFNCSPDILLSLKKHNFSILQLSNNHILDQGINGVTNSVNECNKTGILPIGAGKRKTNTRNGILLNKKQIKVGLLAYTGLMNYHIPKPQKGFFINWFYDKKKVIEDITQLRKKCQYLILMVHTGKEYKTEPEPKDKKIMKAYLDAGVDLIIGHHPHVLQPVEKIVAKDGRICYIFYSLGNFISNQSGVVKFPKKGILSTRDSAIITCTLAKTEKRVSPHFTIHPIFTYNRFEKGVHKVQTVDIIKKIRYLQNNYNIKDRSLPKSGRVTIPMLKKKYDIIKYAIMRNNSYNAISIAPYPRKQVESGGEK